MKIIGDDIRVDFSTFERNQLSDALSIASRLYLSLSPEMQVTDMGVNAGDARDSIIYLLNNSGTDTSVSIPDLLEPLEIEQDQYSALTGARDVLLTLLSTTPSNNDYYLNIDLELPTTVTVIVDNEPTQVEIGLEENPVFLQLHEMRDEDPYVYKLKYEYVTGGNTWQVIVPVNYTVNEDETVEWEIGSGTQYFRVIDGVPVEEEHMSRDYPTAKATLDNLAEDYCLILTDTDFTPSASFNWISANAVATDETNSVLEALTHLMASYAAKEPEATSDTTYEVNFTWMDMPEDNSYSFNLYNDYASVQVIMTHDNDETIEGHVYSHSEDITLTKWEVGPEGNKTEVAYQFDVDSIPYAVTFEKDGTALVNQELKMEYAGEITMDVTNIAYTINWAYHNYEESSGTYEDVGFPEDAPGPLGLTVSHLGGDIVGNIEISAQNIGGDFTLYEADVYEITSDCHVILSIDVTEQGVTTRVPLEGNIFTVSGNGELWVDAYQTYLDDTSYTVNVDMSAAPEGYTYSLDDESTDSASLTLFNTKWNDASGPHTIGHELDAGGGYGFATTEGGQSIGQVITVTGAGDYYIV